MSIEGISDFDELNYVSGIKSNPTNDWEGRKVEISQEKSFSWIKFETRQKEPFSLKNSDREIKPMMVRIRVTHKDKDGTENAGEIEVDTRKPPTNNNDKSKPKSDPKTIARSWI